MDPVSQIALGAALPLSLERWSGTEGSHTRRARDILVAGGLGGFLPDADIFIRSQSDPLLAVQFHRHFTHSLAFAPVVGAFAALMLYWMFRRRRLPLQLWRWTTLGALTHGLLDACTSYGTHLLWPFSNTRTAWNVVSIIDPLYTLPLLALVIATTLIGRPFWARTGLFLSIVYLVLGLVQRDRATAFYRAKIEVRGHSASRVVVKPTFGNLWLWRGIYESGGTLHVDGIRNFPFRPHRVYPGAAVRRIVLERDFAQVPKESVAFGDLERFRFFSNDFLYFVSGDPTTVGDLRFSLLPQSLEPLWVVRVGSNYGEHLPYITTRAVAPEKVTHFRKMLAGEDLPE